MTLPEVASNINAIITIFGVVASAVAWLATHLNLKNKRLAAILQAALVAEKSVDKATYNSDGTFNQARMDTAMAVLKIIDPKIDTTTAQKEIEAALAKVHEAVQSVKDAPVIADPPIPQEAVMPTADPKKV